MLKLFLSVKFILRPLGLILVNFLLFKSIMWTGSSRYPTLPNQQLAKSIHKSSNSQSLLKSWSLHLYYIEIGQLEEQEALQRKKEQYKQALLKQIDEQREKKRK